MPTSYTAGILDGKITNAQEFANVCARAFMINMRDTSMGAPLQAPERYDSYYAEDLPKRVAELQRWDSLSEEEKYAEWSNYAIEQAQRAADAKAEARKNYRLLLGVLTEVERIEVPETHKNFKEFMIDQIKSTMNFDGNFNERHYAVTPYGEWVDSHRQYILRGIEVCAESLKKAEDNYRSGVEWVTTLANLYNLKIEGM